MANPRRPLARPPMAGSPMARPSPRGPGRPVRAVASDEGVSTMKVAGVLLCLSAVAALVVPFATRGSGAAPAADAGSLGGAFMVLLFGAALFQGVNAVRIFVLLCTGLGALAAVVAIALLNSMRELQLVLGTVLLSCAGYLVLLLEKQAPRARAVAGTLLVVAGALGSLGAQVWLSGFERRAFARELRPLLADQGEYSDSTSGLSLKAPAGWSLMKGDAELFKGVPAKVRLADPDAGTVAFIDDEPKPPGLLSLDHYLDSVLSAQSAAGLEPKQKDRRDTAVGKAPARRMSVTWTSGGRPYSGFVSVWEDGPRVFTLSGAAVGGWSERTEERFRALEDALRFSAPVETALSEAQGRLIRQCPVFTADAVRMIGRRIPPTSPPEIYFRTGWSWALRGQSQVDAGAAAELRDLMRIVFSRMSGAERSRFADYSERLRSGRATSAAEDTAAMAILGRAAAALPGESLERLRTRVDASLTVGGLM
jgi:hypothetical protein